MIAPLPWQGPLWRDLSLRLQTGHLPHALLLTGPVGVGKRHLAHAWAARLLCAVPAETACGACADCTLFTAGTHPDFWPITADDAAIKIDAVRALIEGLALTRHRARYKVALVVPAERLTTAAANALLKTLEEPPPDSVLILVSERPALLPATLRSRCQRFAVAIPPTGVALAWLTHGHPDIPMEPLLHLAGGAPLAAQTLAQSGEMAARAAFYQDLHALTTGCLNATALAARVREHTLPVVLRWYYDWLLDLIYLARGAPQRTRYRGHPPEMARLARAMKPQVLFERLDALLGLLRLSELPVNVELQLHALLLPWYRPSERVPIECPGAGLQTPTLTEGR